VVALDEIYKREIEEGLAWNIANKPFESIYSRVEFHITRYKKDRHVSDIVSLGVMRTKDIPDLVIALEELEIKLNIAYVGSKLKHWRPDFTIYHFAICAWVPLINFRINKEVVDDKYVREKYGLITPENVLKEIRKLR
jgi:hypothetical protein